ncbi:MAG: NAD-dependent epimerase/dehydratase family protein, partial [Deltaproteobacteria bacterium]|nr:NAD-dependent epimerase/dehydratase family protein [Deltaproteobacteria bacterium]
MSDPQPRGLQLVTGGSGYLGSDLVRRLVARGAEVRVFDLVDADDRPPDVDFQQGDIRDAAAVARACDGVDAIFHNVAQVPLVRDRAMLQSVNTRGTERLLEAALAAGVRKVIHTSSSAVYGVPSELPVTEATPPTPAEPYGAAKYAAEGICAEFATRGLDVSIIRPRTIVGSGRLGIFQILFEWISQGSNVPVLGRGDNIYQFIHAADLAEACILAAGRAGSAEYNCGAGRFGSMREVLESLCDHAGTGSKVKSVPMRPAIVGMKLTSALGLSPLSGYHWLMYGRSMYFDNAKAESELQWTPRFSNDE